jgi:1-phosphofructokinase
VGEFIKQYTDNLNAGDIVVLAGSLPQGVPMDIYAWLIRIAHNKRCLAYLDTDGEAFKAAMEEQPDFIKPNRHELLEYYGEDEQSADLDVLANLCRRMNNRVERFALSLGGDGAIFVNSGEIIYAPPIKVPVQSTVGAGDSMMGAIAFADSRGYDWHKASALAMAASAGAVTTVGTKTPDKKIVESLSSQVVFERLQYK